MAEYIEHGYDWWALVGPRPSATTGGVTLTPHDRGRCLAEPVDVGPLHLEVGGSLVEWLRPEPRTLDGVRKFTSWPVIVQGETVGSDEAEAFRRGSQLLHRLVCLLALAWNEPWQERTSPKDPRALPPTVPESWPPPPCWPDDGDDPSWLRQDTPLPGWIPAAWKKLCDDRYVGTAASFWHQGLLASPSHPSLALVAFTAAVERLANNLARRGHQDIPASGDRQKVDAAIRLVATEDQQQALTGLYNKRSTTAHGRSLHSIETSAGAFFPVPYIADSAQGLPAETTRETSIPEQRFTLRTLQAAHAVARELMLHELGVQD